MREQQRDAFIKRFGGVYEHSPWVAETYMAQGQGADSNDIDALSGRMASIVDAADDNTKLALLRAHPDLAGRLAVRGELTAASTEEQRSAGLDQCTPNELEKFQKLNAAYTEKFGFPFILAVTGKTRAQILENFEQRLSNAADEEFATALQEVHKIARIRLETLLNEKR